MLAWRFHGAVRDGRRTDLSNEGGLLGRDPRLCGVITDFLSELSGRGFGLDHGGGCFVATTWE